MHRCDGCGRPTKAPKQTKSPIQQRLEYLQKEQERLETKLTACLMEQAKLTKELEGT